jgi:heterotetrameric sarcosine oxidase gamma subunit
MPVFAAEALDLVQIGVRRGREADFAAALATLGLAPPPPGEVRSAGGCDLIWLQPNTSLLAASRGAMPGLAALAPFAALVEQSDGRSAFTLSGPRAREVLAKGCRLDFHPRVFGPGRAAGALLAHVNAVIQQLDRDRPASSAGRESPVPDDPEPAFRIIVFSSFAQHIAEWLGHATASA